MARGRFITFEGEEGAGKSTHARRLADALAAIDIDALVTREPGGSPGAEEVRALLVTGTTGRWSPMTEALLHYAARRDHLDRTVLPALDDGRWVISDRFADSTLVYQGYGLGLDGESIRRLHRLVVGEVVPDLTIILDLSVDVGLLRASARTGAEDRYERMDMAFHHRLRDGFLDIARREPERCVVVDAEGAVEDVERAIRAAVAERLGVRL